MHHVGRAQRRNEFPSLVRVGVAEKHPAPGGVKMANHGLAYLAGAVCQDNDLAMEGFFWQGRWGEPARVGCENLRDGGEGLRLLCSLRSEWVHRWRRWRGGLFGGCWRDCD